MICSVISNIDSVVASWMKERFRPSDLWVSLPPEEPSVILRAHEEWSVIMDSLMSGILGVLYTIAHMYARHLRALGAKVDKLQSTGSARGGRAGGFTSLQSNCVRVWSPLRVILTSCVGRA